MKRLWLALPFLLLGVGVPPAWAAASPYGTWLISQRIAINVYPCGAAVCGRVAWLRNPTLRTPELCGRVIVWGLLPDGPGAWNRGRFYDPEDGDTYNVRAEQQGEDHMSARIYAGLAIFGRTETLIRIADRSLPGWCERAG